MRRTGNPNGIQSSSPELIAIAIYPGFCVLLEKRFLG
ncbi:hypothetical protein I41_04200 [Lacipirellula limnantheis]|uniref:Uncharacterized protein n=1 Tax=Lacipirellula limnantheis TaxID=2528024 RepID=A0A517TSB9_9BACT|nr:hypothetical protein I41_04200 [Lacipirellula limnantheis]